MSTSSIAIEEIGKFHLETKTNQICNICLYDTIGYGNSIDNKGSIPAVKDYIIKKHFNWLSVDGQQLTDDVIIVKNYSVFFLLFNHCFSFYFGRIVLQWMKEFI
jgi:hypothetical protein